MIEGSRGEARDRNVLEITTFFVVTDRVEEIVFPSSTSAKEMIIKNPKAIRGE
jgi:hypothetical protein